MCRAGVNKVCPCACTLSHGITSVIYIVCIITCAADHRIRARSTINNVITAVTGNHIGRGITCTINITTACQRQVFNVRAQRICRSSINKVCPLACILCHCVTGSVYIIGIVACTANHRIIARTAIQRIIPATAVQRIRAAIAGNHVIQRIARAINICTAR